MNPLSKLGIVLLGLGLCGISTIACNKDEEDTVTVAPAAPKFEGKIRPEFAGAWASADDRSKMMLDKTGTASVTATAATRAGVQSSVQTGHWLTGDGTILLQLSSGTGEQVLQYYVKLPKSDTMELRGRPDSKIPMTYHRAH